MFIQDKLGTSSSSRTESAGRRDREGAARLWGVQAVNFRLNSNTTVLVVVVKREQEQWGVERRA